MKWPLSKLYKITTPTRLHLISLDKPDSFSSRRSLLVAAFSYIIKKCIPPHPSRYSLDTFSRLGEGFYRYALCKKLGCSCQLPHSTTPDSCIQLCPPVARRCNRRGACVARSKGKYSRGRMALAPIRTREFSPPRVYAAIPPSSLTKSAFTSHTGSLVLS